MAASGGAGLSVDRLLDIIRQHSRGWRRDRLKPFPELRFTYEEGARGVRAAVVAAGGGGRRAGGGQEGPPALSPSYPPTPPTPPCTSSHPEASPEEFFWPYVWSLVVAQGGIPFSLPAIVLFTPTGACQAWQQAARCAGLLSRAAAPPPWLMAVRRAPLPQWCQTWRARMRRRSPVRW